MSRHDDKLLARVRAVLGPMILDQRLTEDVQDGAAKVCGCTDLLDAMKGLGGLALTADDAEESAKRAAATARAMLLEAMEDTSATTLRLPHHTVSLVDGKPAFTVTDAGQIPPTLMRQADPVPDRAAIQKLLNAGQDVPGVVRRNTSPHVAFRPHSGAAA